MGGAQRAAVDAQKRRLRIGRSTREAHHAGHEGAATLRIGVERGMVATVAVAGPLLILLSLPAFTIERGAAPQLVALSLFLVVVLCLFVPLALLRPGAPVRGWLLLSAVTYCVLIALERSQLRVPLPQTSTPWLIGIACVALSCVAIGMQQPMHSGAASAITVAGLSAVYAGLVPVDHLVINALALTALAAGLIVGTRALRDRADRADTARLAAQQAFVLSRRQMASEAERSRTDALLHDSVLSALLTAAAGHDVPQRTLVSAQNALEIVSDPQEHDDAQRLVLPFEHAVSAMERELAPVRDLVQLDLAAADHVELPLIVAETLVSATLQALSNSIKHAGPSAACSAVASPTTDGGVRITVRDEGPGFDMSQIAAERLGVRVSIIERMTMIGGIAQVHSTLGTGTVVVLEWSPGGAEPAPHTQFAVSA